MRLLGPTKVTGGGGVVDERTECNYGIEPQCSGDDEQKLCLLSKFLTTKKQIRKLIIAFR